MLSSISESPGLCGMLLQNTAIPASEGLLRWVSGKPSPNSAKAVGNREKDGPGPGLRGLRDTHPSPKVVQGPSLGPRSLCACPVNVLWSHTTLNFPFQKLDEQYLAWAETCRVMRSVAICVLHRSPDSTHTAFSIAWALLPDSAVGLMLEALSPVLKQVCPVVRIASSRAHHPPLFCSFTARPSSLSENDEILDPCILTLRVLSAGSAQGCWSVC